MLFNYNVHLKYDSNLYDFLYFYVIQFRVVQINEKFKNLKGNENIAYGLKQKLIKLEELSNALHPYHP